MQQGPDLILERLDKCLISQTAEDLCPKLCVNNLPRDSSDQCPMHICFNYEDICMPRPFHFMAMWIKDPTCRDIIANSWSVNMVGSPAYKLKAKLLSTKKGLRDWNKSSFGNIQTNISTIRKDLVDLQLSNPTDTNNTSRLKARLEYLYNLEELYWKDKSREFQDEILADLPIKFSVEDIALLNMPLTPEEIKNVVFQMGGKKVPGPDGFTGLFYQKYWDIVGDAVIDMTQTCFRTWHIAKRSISSNILLANEAIYVFNHNDKVEGIAAIKLDMSKAYDKLEWDFVEKVLTEMGMSNQWVKLINQCVPIVSYSVLLNGSPTGFFQPERGLKQGDPLSPYLYIICSEALSSYTYSLQKKGILEGIKVCKDAPEMTHFLFADDSLLFSKAITQNFQVIKDYLQKYCLASMQEINFEKIGIMFSMKNPEHRKAFLANILEISSRDLGQKYLGTPTVFQASKIQTHMGILQDVDARISIWLHKLLSQASRTTLIKHIGQAIPLFQMGSFLIPKHLSEGGLGFRKDELNNLSMLARNAWRILENPNCLLATVLKARYFPRADFLNAKCTGKCSWTWKCLHAIKELIKPFISWIVGDGQFIDAWCDKWIPTLDSATPNPLVPPDPSIKVSYFIDPQSRSWDVRAWDLSKNGKFSSKSVYLGLRGLSPSPCKNLWKRIWKVRVPYIIQVFLWRAARNDLPSRTILHTTMPMHSVDCPRCSDPHETIMHALVTSPFASRVWFISDFNIKTQFFQNKSFIDWLLFWLIEPQSKLLEDDQCLFVAILWSLWTSRNNFIFQNTRENHTSVLARAKAMLLTRKTSLPGSTSFSVSICDKWMPPLIGWIKCNTDGSFDIISGVNGAGYVMRYFSRKATFCASLVFGGTSNSHHHRK
ncbi:uncharacterized protein LOC113311963 [Papaver somniferum]|uniref:uncharacterized protein LOC113311963 n=1 Tax=Papaver somniferum TaxID=3469 RepID=UPI000E6FC18A|nr:uncharacterized protein LOC113311963 [Papaver somniferum]